MKSNIKIKKDSEKILIIGANGFLGKNILQLKSMDIFKEKEICFIAGSRKNENFFDEIPFAFFDITKKKDTINKIKKIAPNVVILTAAITNVDQCEINKKLAERVNIKGAKNVIKACLKINSKLVFLSTDYVFDGTRKNYLYNEKDAPNPLNFYAKTKYITEQNIINSELDYIICRSAVLYGWNNDKLNFITWILTELQQKKEISILTTQINNATYIKNLAKIILKLIEKDAVGIFHTAGIDALNRYEMAIKCADAFNFEKNLIKPIKYLKQKAIRPENAGLEITKLKNLLGSELKILNFEEGLRCMKDNDKNKN